MNFAQEKNGASRFTGLGLVILIHIVIVYAIASGLARKAVEAIKGPIETKVIEEKVKPPPPPDKVIPPPPDLKAPPPPYVPPPEFTVTAPAPPAVMAAPTTSVPPANTTVAAKPAKVTAGMVCTKMGKPEMPSVSWSGEALYKVVATVKAGRVAAIEVTSLRSGVDRKAQRALIGAIETTLRESYECPGDHVFEQEFQFKLE